MDAAIGDSDEDDNDGDNLDEGMEEIGPEEEPHDHIEAQSPVIPIPATFNAHPPPPFHMVDFLHQTSSYNLIQVFQDAQAMPVIPVHIPCERPGGEARRAIMKARAHTVPRSVCETFAFCSSRTISAEDTAVVLETFGNVRLNNILLYVPFYLSYFICFILHITLTVLIQIYFT